ncbi:aldose 1-epimerase [Histoplasma capsulatum H143]|uniref:Aldose 1-epimerase n=1 Tax=Ajellomyces capsulatus (strain H143) TaxID=544712 RepID=C6H916_AJECH|nr:aldose 1-epimerase [Histoplasma capsulatum H143]
MASSLDESAFTFIALGGILQEFRVAGQNIVLGFDAQRICQYTPHISLDYRRTTTGYPGTVELRVWHTAGKSYFNLGDGPTIEGTEAILATDNYLPTDSTGIPISTIERYTSTQVNKPFFLGATSPDIDDCFVVDTDPASIPADTRSRPLRLNAALRHLVTGIHLEVHSTEPAFQFYTGKYINIPSVGSAPARGPRSGFCVEPSRYINAPNEPNWRGMSVLRKGQIWGSKIVYKAWKE